ncbi:uncharacterized protein LOC127835112 [Dreissena polymorpha]|uniref:Uncharacterized protein n=1 Tax=Dreissena polymorpha TaxID=45954 RepID=A0A9D4FXX2_DREPO|nr:uncharacterized protein LOC127835112 [Dreissena polymorpha]KAH3805574.1 hypothetical protein DPMN_133878 [Dreissena polymorpha]
MRSQPSRPVTRIPVLCEREIPPVDFCINTMQPLLTLGGNHMVTAMKDLLIEEAGNPDYECLRQVDVEVYVGLTPREAMFVASWHNIQCSQKPMNFQDKVRMARKIYESRSTCSSNWKGEVMVALGSLDKKACI